MERIIIGLVGHPSCGKDTVAEYLANYHGFTHVSTSNLIRDYIKENSLGEPTRALLAKVSTTLRAKKGGDIFIRLSLENNSSKLALTGMRAPAEVEAVKKAGGKIIAFTAPIEVRYQRAFTRGRVGENITFEMFKEADMKDSVSADPNAQNVNAVVAMADYVIENTGTLQDLYKKVDEVLPQVYN